MCPRLPSAHRHMTLQRRANVPPHSPNVQLLEVVMDLGRTPLARFPYGDVEISDEPIGHKDLELAVAQVADFGSDNRAGINATLHRISCMRNRSGRIVGLTARVGRSVPGSAAMITDLAMDGASILLLGRPGARASEPCSSQSHHHAALIRKVLLRTQYTQRCLLASVCVALLTSCAATVGVGKTTAIREVSRLLAGAVGKRVVICDTSNEIGGDGDVPHPGIGRARRMQVVTAARQHEVMIEAVENHMPQVRACLCSALLQVASVWHRTSTPCCACTVTSSTFRGVGCPLFEAALPLRDPIRASTVASRLP